MPQNLRSRQRARVALLAAFAAAGLPLAASAADVVKANNTTQLSDAASWVGNPAAVPGPGDIATYTSAVGANSSNIGSGLSVQGLQFASNPGGNITIGSTGGGNLTLGTSGINVSGTAAGYPTFSSNRSLTIAAPVVLGANQTWRLSDPGFGANSIVVNNAISGDFKLTVAGSGNAAVGVLNLNGANTFTGFELEAGSAVKVRTSSVAANGVVSSGSMGRGPITINGGTIFGGAAVASSSILIKGDFAVNVGNNTTNGRLDLSGAIDLQGAERTITLGRTAAFGTALNSQESLRLATVGTGSTAGPAISVSNGTMRLVGDSSSNSTNIAVFNVQNTAAFINNAGLVIGANVVTAFPSANMFGTTANSVLNVSELPTVTVETGGYLNLGNVGVAAGTQVRGQTIAGLNGAGAVTSLAGTAGTAILNVGNNNVSGNFTGVIVDGASLNSTTGLSAAGVVAITKSGNGTQTLSGLNTYSGATLVNGGTLLVNGTHTVGSGTAGAYTVNTGGTLGGTGTINLSAVNLGVSIATGGKLQASSTNAFDFSLGSGVLNISAAVSGANVGAMAFELGAPGTLINVGSLNIGAAALEFNDFSFTTTAGFGGGVYRLFDYTSFAGTSSLGSNLTGMINGLNATISNDIANSAIVLTVIPEPSSFAALAGLGALGCVGLRRRRRA